MTTKMKANKMQQPHTLNGIMPICTHLTWTSPESKELLGPNTAWKKDKPTTLEYSTGQSKQRRKMERMQENFSWTMESLMNIKKSLQKVTLNLQESVPQIVWEGVLKYLRYLWWDLHKGYLANQTKGQCQNSVKHCVSGHKLNNLYWRILNLPQKADCWPTSSHVPGYTKKALYKAHGQTICVGQTKYKLILSRRRQISTDIVAS